LVTILSEWYSSVVGKTLRASRSAAFSLNSSACLRPRGPDEEAAEDVEDPAELLDGGGADEDEHRPQHQGEGDAEQQHLLLQFPRHGEAGHDEHEDEQVVDREALLGDVPGEVLTGELTAAEPQDQQSEDHGDADVDSRPDGRLAQCRCVRGAHVTDEIEDEHPHDRGDREGPHPEGHVHGGYLR
jgi:hypothetical protein